MRLQTQTPLGRLANATRDNFERAEFVGYDPRMVRFYQYVLSGFFAGIAGALYAILYEIVTFDTVSAPKSATALLATYIGGVGGFYGPILGTILIVLLQSGVSLLSNAWLLYVGVLFIVMVMFAPNGILGLIAMHGPIARSGRLRPSVPYLRVLVPGLIFVWRLRLAGRDGVLRDYRRRAGKSFKLGGITTSIRSRCRPGWLPRQRFAIAALWLRLESRAFGRVWDALNEKPSSRGGLMNAPASTLALKLENVRKSFGHIEIIRGVASTSPQASATPSSAPMAPARPRCST